MRRLGIVRFVALVALAAAACGRDHHVDVLDGNGVHAEQHPKGIVVLSAGGLEVQRLIGDDGDALAALRLDGDRNAGPIADAIFFDDKRAPLDHAHLELRDGTPALVQQIVGAGPGAEIVTTMIASAPAVVQRVHLVDASKTARWTLSRGRFDTLMLSSHLSVPASRAIAPVDATWAMFHEGGRWIVVASSDGMRVQGAAGLVSFDVATKNGDGAIAVSVARDLAGAQRTIAAVDATSSKGAMVILEPRDDHGAAIQARVMIDGPFAPPLDPTRNADADAPLVDVTSDAFPVRIPPGKYVLRATHGIGWSIAHLEIEVKDGDVIEAPLTLRGETPTPAYVGCDFHVHAKGSFDAPDVTYEDRVRSLVAVGVECAAATEHNHVGDHGPAAVELGLDDVFRALTGVELTTKNPIFGHFNVYPWPAGAEIPKVEGTTPDALFDAVHAMRKPDAPDFVFQLNHPRMRNGDDSMIGYLDILHVDPKTGIAQGPLTVRKDYDTIEVFNGYNLDAPDRVVSQIEEWTRMLDRGDVHVATGSSDSHHATYPWAGFPRTLVEVGEAWHTGDRSIDAIVAALKKGKAIVTGGPIVELTVGAASLGDAVKSSGSKAHVTVRLTSWLDAPVLRLILGDADLPNVSLTPGGDHTWTADVALPAVDRKRPLVAFVAANVVGDGAWISGMKRSLAVTNPIWLLP
jgi:hypothetical protein